jgi:hypothetical protein
VKFVYNSFQTGRPTTHFCIVNSASAGTIIDSWDGQVKSWNAYPGGPKEWAEYAQTNAQPVSPAQGEDMAMTADFVTNMYRYVAGREPSAADVSFQVQKGTPASLLNAFIANGDLATKVLGAQIATLQGNLDTTNKTLSDLQAKVDSLSKQLAAADDANATLKQENTTLNSKLSATQKAVDNLTKTNSDLTAKLAAGGNGQITVRQAVNVLIQAIKDLVNKGV